jgi:hypothetical protein
MTNDPYGYAKERTPYGRAPVAVRAGDPPESAASLMTNERHMRDCRETRTPDTSFGKPSSSTGSPTQCLLMTND